MHLKKAACEWFEPTLKDDLETNDPQNKNLGNVAKFEIAINQVFGTISEERAATCTIHRIKQPRSAAQHYSQFHAVASKLN
jgi:hypothetical protein